MAIATLIAFVVAPFTRAEAIQCPLFWNRSAVGNSFSLDFFRAEKKLFSENPDLALDLESRKEPESILAWLEARSQRHGLGLDLESNPEKLEARGVKWSKAFRKDETSRFKLESAVLSLFEQNHHKSFKDPVAKFGPDIVGAIQKRVAGEILGGELSQAFEALGVRVRPGDRDKILYRLRMAGGIDWAASSALTVLSPQLMKAMVGHSIFMPFIPTAHFEQYKRLPEPIKRKILEQGFDAAKEDLLAHFKVPARASFVWNRARQVFYLVCLILFLELLYEYSPWAESLFKSLWQSKEDFFRQREALGADVIREQLFNGWKDWYKAQFKQEPSESDISAARARLARIKDEQLIRAPN